MGTATIIVTVIIVCQGESGKQDLKLSELMLVCKKILYMYIKFDKTTEDTYAGVNFPHLLMIMTSIFGNTNMLGLWDLISCSAAMPWDRSTSFHTTYF